MSYTFNVSYKSVPKKVTCARSATVNDLTIASLEKFKIPAKNGSLTHSGKTLDPLLPVRFTNLVNNAKLVLQVTAGGSEVTLKVAASFDGTSVTKIIKLSLTTTLSGLVEEFRDQACVTADWADKRIQLSVLQTVKDNLSGDFSSLIGSLIGNSSNAVVRLLVENKDIQEKRTKLQEEQRLLREKLNEKKHQERLEQRERELMEKEAKGASTALEVPKGEPEVSSMESVTQTAEVSEISESSAGRTISDTPSGPLGTSNETEQTQNKPLETPLPPVQPPQRETFRLPEEKEDTLYVPNSTTQMYENPDEDYNMTMGQAEKYYKLIKSMQAPTTKKESVVPQKYVIRLRFPDRSLLDLPIEDPTMKLGQLLKKIDSYVAEPFVNTYRLKNGSPPFQEIAIGFSFNNTALQDHPDFQLEKLLLIWEPSAGHNGPYLKDGITTKETSELPTLVLESNRGQLGEDAEPVKIAKKASGEKKRGIPKWLRK